RRVPRAVLGRRHRRWHAGAARRAQRRGRRRFDGAHRRGRVGGARWTLAVGGLVGQGWTVGSAELMRSGRRADRWPWGAIAPRAPGWLACTLSLARTSRTRPPIPQRGLLGAGSNVGGALAMSCASRSDTARHTALSGRLRPAAIERRISRRPS